MKKNMVAPKKKAITIITVALSCIITVILFILSKIKPEEPPLVFVVKKRDIISTEGLSGTVEYGSSICVSSESELPVKSVLVSVGDEIKKGDELFVVDTSALSEELEKYEELYKNELELLNIDNEFNSKKTSLSNRSNELMLEIYKQEYDSVLQSNERLKNHISEYESILSTCESQMNSINEQMNKADISSVDIIQSEAQDDDTVAYAGTDVSEDTIISVDTEEQNISDATNVSESTEDEIDLDDTQTDNNDYTLLQMKYDILSERYRTFSELLDSTQKQMEEQNSLIKELEHTLNLTSLEIGNNYSSLSDQSLINSYKSKISELKKLIENPVYCSPINGIITEVSIVEGFPCSNDYCVTVSDITSKSIVLSVAPEKWDLLKSGMNVKLSSDVLNSEVIEGKISIASDAYIDDKYYAEVIIDGKQEVNFFGGENVYARIITSEKNNVLAVPYDSIDEIDGKSYVYVKKGNDAVKTEITTGIKTDYYTEIKGIDEGTTIFLSAKDGKNSVKENN